MQVYKVIVGDVVRSIATVYADGNTVMKFADKLAKVNFSYCINEHWFDSETEILIEDYMTFKDIERNIKNMMNRQGE